MSVEPVCRQINFLVFILKFKKQLKENKYSLVPSKYIEFVNRDEKIDFDEKMVSLQSEFTELLKEEVKSKDDLLLVFKNLGYEIKL